MMIDPVGHEHRQRDGRTHHEDDRQRPGQRRDQPPDRGTQRDQHHAKRKERSDATGKPFRFRHAHERPQQQDQRRDGKIDDPRPVDVEARRRIEPIVAQIIPALPVEQGTHLHQAHIVVGIAQRQPVDRRPALPDVEDRDHHPCDGGQLDPVPVQLVGKRCQSDVHGASLAGAGALDARHIQLLAQASRKAPLLFGHGKGQGFDRLSPSGLFVALASSRGGTKGKAWTQSGKDMHRGCRRRSGSWFASE